MTDSNNPSPLWQSFLVWLVLLITVIVSYILIKTQATVEKQARPEFKPVVKTESLVPQNKLIQINSRGIVEESQTTKLAFQVSGNVLSISKSFEPGQFIKKGEVLAELSRIDFEVALANSQAKVAQAKLNLTQEEQNKFIALEDWKSYPNKNNGKPSPLLLKEPQVILAQKNLQAAITEAEQAKVNLERAVLRAPYDGIIAKRDIFIGSIVTGTTIVGEIINNNECWVRGYIPIDILDFIQRNGQVEGATTHVIARASNKIVFQKTGLIHKILPRLEGQTRLAQIMINVSNPYDITDDNKIYLFSGLSVELKIDAVKFADVIVLKREHLKENDHIWLFDDGKLKIEPVEVLFKNATEVVLKKGDWVKYPLIVSDLPLSKNGMSLELFMSMKKSKEVNELESK